MKNAHYNLVILIILVIVIPLVPEVSAALKMYSYLGVVTHIDTTSNTLEILTESEIQGSE